MKPLVFALISMFIFSCNRDHLLQENPLNGSTQEENGRLEDQAAAVPFAKHMESSPIRGYHNDAALDTTKAIGSNEKMRYGSILFNGNSLFRNFKDDTAWRYMARGFDVIDRGISGSMWRDLYTHRDSLIYDYKPRQIIFYMIENEISEYILARSGWTPQALEAADSIVIKSTLLAFEQLFNDVRLRLPNTKLTLVQPNKCPWHVSKGMTHAIDVITSAYRDKINSDIANGNKASFIEMNGINDDTAYYRDGVHFKIPSNAYGRWAANMKPHFIKRDTVVIVPQPPDSSVTPPTYNPVPGNLPAIARAGVDQVIPLSWNWFPNLNANASTDPDGWIRAFKWQQISGPTQVTFANANTGNTKVYGWAVGKYLFRVAVTDSKYAISYDDIYITVTNN